VHRNRQRHRQNPANYRLGFQRIQYHVRPAFTAETHETSALLCHCCRTITSKEEAFATVDIGKSQSPRKNHWAISKQICCYRRHTTLELLRTALNVTRLSIPQPVHPQFD
jgi:hypothetical protein